MVGPYCCLACRCRRDCQEAQLKACQAPSRDDGTCRTFDCLGSRLKDALGSTTGHCCAAEMMDVRQAKSHESISDGDERLTFC